MRIKGHRYAIHWLRLKQLETHPTVQRKFDEANAKRIARDFNADALEDLGVVPNPSKRDHYHVFLGQHRLAALKEKFGSEAEVRCRVYDSSLSESELADMQYRMSLGTKSWRAFDAFRLKLLRGDSSAVEILAVIREHSLRLEMAKSKNCVAATKALESVYARCGKDGLNRVVGILHRMWGGDPDAYHACLLRGFGLVVHRYNGEIDDKALGDAIKKHDDAGGLLGRARSMSKANGTSVPAAVAEAVVRSYNARRTSRRLASFRD